MEISSCKDDRDMTAFEFGEEQAEEDIALIGLAGHENNKKTFENQALKDTEAAPKRSMWRLFVVMICFSASWAFFSQNETQTKQAPTTIATSAAKPLFLDLVQKGPARLMASHPFNYEGLRFLDAIVTVNPSNSTEAALYFFAFSLNWAGGGSCTFPSGSVTPMGLVSGGEAWTCPVPEAEAHRASQSALLDVTIEHFRPKGKPRKTAKVQASTWPWQRRRSPNTNEKPYKVAVTNMNKNVECGKDLEKHCFHDWILWHQMQGVEHFFIYDNNSDLGSAWLKAVAPYVNQGVVTLIDWPMRLGGPGNNMAQRVQMNHAMFATYHLVDYLGYFDVDEFLFLKPFGQFPTNHTEQTTAFDMLEAISHDPKFDPKLTWEQRKRIVLGMRIAEHPDDCQSRGFQVTTRLAACDTFVEPSKYGHSKIFFQTDAGPSVITTPHKGWTKAPSMHFMHYARKYGCKLDFPNPPKSNIGTCITQTELAESPLVKELEEKLSALKSSGPGEDNMEDNEQEGYEDDDNLGDWRGQHGG